MLKQIKYFVSYIFLSAYLIACNTQQKIKYEFPAEMTNSVKVEYLKLCNKGKNLFLLNCAKCHYMKFKGKEVIPDFNPAQLESYQIRISNLDHMKFVREDNISAEELGYVITFLTYKKKSGVAWKSN